VKLFETLEKIKNSYSSDKESLVQEAYNNAFRECLNVNPTREFKCDAHFVAPIEGSQKSLDILAEYKFSLDFSKKEEISKVLCQAVFYLKAFHERGIPPTTLFVGDVNECFSMHTNVLLKFITRTDIDWAVQPSSAWKKCTNLYAEIIADPECMPQVYKVDDGFDFKATIIHDLINSTLYTRRNIVLNDSNILRFFEYFRTEVIKDKVLQSNSKLLASSIYQLFLKKTEVMVGNNEAHFEGMSRRVKVDSQKLNVIIRDCVDKYNVQQLKDLTSVFDRLINDDYRRKEGKFYTPSLLVAKAHEYTDEALGPDWRQRCVVWDCCCGTGNLTRDYAFGELYCSTLDQEEIDVGKHSHSFSNVKEVFQYDFLNGTFEDLPESLRNSIEEGKELTFFVNPPYAAGSFKRAGNTKTEVAELMKDKGLNAEDLISQFLFRMKNISRSDVKVNICLFSNATWLTGPKYKSLREDFAESTNFESGFVVDSKEFSGTYGGWPIIFSMFKVDSTVLHRTFNSFEYEIYETGAKYTFFNRSESELPINSLVKLRETYEVILNSPSTSTGLTVNTTNKSIHHVKEGSLGYFLSKGNCRKKSNQECALWSMPYSDKHGVSIHEENFQRACEVFTARILSKSENYYDELEEYLCPTEDILGSESYAYFGSQALIISIFNAKAKPTSVEFDHNGKHWVFKNHFFWMSKSEFYKDVLERDLLIGEEDEVPYMITAMEHQCITKEGMDILNTATELLQLSNYDRASFSEQNPELQLHHWDAGYKQLKQWWNDLATRDEAFKLKYDDFKKMYSEFEKSVKPLVWDLGFLRSNLDSEESDSTS